MMTNSVVADLLINIRHDGRVIFELRTKGRKILANAEFQVEETAAIGDCLTGWANQATHDVLDTNQMPIDVYWERHSGYQVLINGQDSAALHEFTSFSEALGNRFREVFLDSDGTPNPITVRDLSRQIATAVRHFFRISQLRARERLAGGAYLPILEGYLEVMKSKVDEVDQKYHDFWERGIGKIIFDESYLRFSENEAVRSTYSAILAEASDLYNWGMDLAKGGLVRSRRSS